MIDDDAPSEGAPLMASRPQGEFHGKVRSVKVPVAAGSAQLEVVVNKDAKGRPAEVFVHRAPAGSRSATNAMARLASLALQRGVEPAEVARMMRHQHDGEGAVPWPGGGFVLSIPDAVGRILEEEAGADEPHLLDDTVPLFDVAAPAPPSTPAVPWAFAAQAAPPPQRGGMRLVLDVVSTVAIMVCVFVGLGILVRAWWRW